MIVRRATIKDIKPLAQLFNGYRMFYKQDSNIEAANTFLQERFNKEDSVIFIATTQDKTIGFTQLYPLFSSVSMQRTYVLNDLFVDNNYRKSGVGKALLEKAKWFCKTKKAKGLTLETGVQNPAQNLYKRLDWVKDTEVAHYTWQNPNI